MQTYVYDRAVFHLDADVDWVNDDVRCALLTHGYALDHTDEFFADLGAVEIADGAGYTAGGVALPNRTVTNPPGFTAWLSGPASWTVPGGATLTCYWALVYKQTGDPATSPLIAAVLLDTAQQDVVNTGGPFTITFDPVTGVFMVEGAKPTGPTGPTGPPGPSGVDGQDGQDGSPGVPGPQGPPGTAGPPGASGAPGVPGSVWWFGTGAPATGLGTSGDAYMANDTGNVYAKSGTTWVGQGSMLGAPGGQGPAGLTGAPGTPGSRWLFGTGVPAGTLGATGDVYVNNTNGDLYLKTGSSTWSLQGNIKGAQGNQGPVGSTGAAGPTGPTGSVGPAGPGVKTGGVPAASLIKNTSADFDTLWKILGPVDVGATPSGQGLPGPPTYPAGSAGQFLMKNSAAGYDSVWHTLAPGDLTPAAALATQGVPAGGSVGRPLIKSSGTDYAMVWSTTDGQFVIPNQAVLASAASISAYPVGMSMFALTAAQSATDGGWPLGATSTAGQVVTWRQSSTVAGYQIWARQDTTATDMWYRNMLSASNAPWIQLGDPSYYSRNSTTAPSIAPGAYVVVPIATTNEANNGTDIVPSGNGFQINRAGMYRVDLVLTMNGNAGGNVTATVSLGSLSAVGSGFYRVSNFCDASSWVACGSWLIPYNIGDTIGVWFFHNAAANATLGNRRLSVQRVAS
jgi:hypothetical protein